jgi:hypothetical protein
MAVVLIYVRFHFDLQLYQHENYILGQIKSINNCH